MKTFIKRNALTCILLSCFTIGCGNKMNDKGNIANNDITNEKNSKTTLPLSNDKYVGTWQDVNSDPNDNSELIVVTKQHDNEYQIGALAAQQKKVRQNNKMAAEYLSAWTEDVEVQFIYDNYTKHLMMRTPFQTKELKKIK